MGQTRVRKTINIVILLGIMAFSALPAFAQYSRIYENYLDEARSAILRHEYRQALLYLETAQSVDPNRGGQELAQYFNIVKRALEERIQQEQPVSSSEEKASTPPIQKPVLTNVKPVKAQQEPVKSISATLPKQIFKIVKPVTSQVAKSVSSPSKKFEPVAQDKKTPTQNVVKLDEGMWAQQPNMELDLPMDQEILFRGQGIERFLAVTPEVIDVERVGARELVVVPKRYGQTFFHIWDGDKRWTFHIKTLFVSQVKEREGAQRFAREQYVDPFRFTYDLGWNSFSSGPSLNDLKRQSLSIRNYMGLTGPTPYGDFDAYGITYKTDVQSTELTNYSVGLTGARWKDFKDTEIRLFDANKFISDLTFPGRDFRGVMLDTKTVDDRFGITFLRGRDQASFGVLSPGVLNNRDSYFEAGKFSYNPDPSSTMAFNYARSWGRDKPVDASSNVFSTEYLKNFDQWSLFSEVGYDQEDYAQLLWARYSGNNDTFFAKIRNIPRDYATASGAPTSQGEVGTEFSYRHNWYDDAEIRYYLDLYRDRENKNPEDPNAVNIDFNTTMHQRLSDHDFMNGNLYFIKTPGLLSDRKDFRLSSTYGHRFDIFSISNAVWTFTGLYQRNRSYSSPSSDYDRQTVTSYINVPLTRHLSSSVGYEASYVNDVAGDEKSYPTVFTADTIYAKALSDKWKTNLAAYYRNEEHTEDTKSFLAGQDSLTLSSNLTYLPHTGTEIYLDGRVRDVWAENSRASSFTEADIRFGVHSEWDIGFRWNPTAIIQGYVFKDQNHDGTRNDGEAGIPGVRVKVGNQEVVTDSDGWYYARVHAVKVVMNLDLDTIPQGFVFQDVSSWTLDLEHNHYYDANFAMSTESGIYGVAYYDENNNGRPDNGDKFLSKVKLILDGKQVATTDSKGSYFFYNVAEGKHELSIDISSIPMEFLPKIPLKNEINISEGASYIFHVPVKERAQATK